MSETAGKPITCKAMVARAMKQPLVEEPITVDPPKAFEVRVKVMANALCHTGTYSTISLDDSCPFFLNKTRQKCCSGHHPMSTPLKPVTVA